MFAPPPTPGWLGAVATTYVDGKKLTGGDGKDLQLLSPGGTVPLPAPIPAGLSPSYAPNAVTLKSDGRATIGSVALGYIGHTPVAGGQWLLGAVLPIANARTNITPVFGTPSLQWPNAAVPPAPIRAGVEAGFAPGYQANIQALGAERSGEVTGIGDLELTAAWLYGGDAWRVRAALGWVLPTGKYDASPSPDIGLGNFHTVRPEVQLTYFPTAQVALSGKVALGFNTKNKDNQLRSGDWASVEAAAGYMTPVGPVGLHAVHVQQYEDDVNNTLFGAARFSLTGLGAFFSTRIPVLDAALALQHMVTMRSEFARHSNFTQVRLIIRF
jgi:hypothetical protein